MTQKPPLLVTRRIVISSEALQIINAAHANGLAVSCSNPSGILGNISVFVHASSDKCDPKGMQFHLSGAGICRTTTMVSDFKEVLQLSFEGKVLVSGGPDAA